MNKPIVLVIHGMGTHALGEMKKDVSEGLNEAAVNFGLESFKIESKVEFIEFNYSDFLEVIRKRDAAQAATMADHLTLLKAHGLGASVVEELTSFFSDFDEDEMLYTHWMDVVYYGLMFWGEKIRVDCAKKLNDVLVTAHAENRDVHIVAHSLGTAVLHDTLAKLYRGDVDITSKVANLDIAKFTVKSIWMVANVSRLLNILNDIADPENSIVHSGHDGCAASFYNVRNKFDPFTWIKKYDRQGANLETIEVNTVRQLNTHDMKEYMATPYVADCFFASVLGNTLTSEQWDKGELEHGKKTVNKSVEELELAFTNLRQVSGITGKVDALKKFFTLLKEFQDELKELIEDDEA